MKIINPPFETSLIYSAKRVCYLSIAIRSHADPQLKWRTKRFYTNGRACANGSMKAAQMCVRKDNLLRQQLNFIADESAHFVNRIRRLVDDVRGDHYGLLLTRERSVTSRIGDALAPLGERVRLQTVVVEEGTLAANQSPASLSLRPIIFFRRARGSPNRFERFRIHPSIKSALQAVTDNLLHRWSCEGATWGRFALF